MSLKHLQNNDTQNLHGTKMNNGRYRPLFTLILMSFYLAGCTQMAYVTPDPVQPHTHIQPSHKTLPPPPALATPQLHLDNLLSDNPLEKRYTLSFKNTPLKRALYVLTRKTGLQLDMRPLPAKKITLYIKDAPLRVILDHISEQAGIRYQLKQNILTLEKDLPYWKTYKIDYVNISSNYNSTSNVSLQLGTETNGNQTNSSQNRISTHSQGKNQFWNRLQSAVSTILNENKPTAIGTTPKPITKTTATPTTSKTRLSTPASQPPQAAQSKSNNVFINQEAGLLLAYATSRQHKKIAKLINTITHRAKKQVLIEATVVEVDLSKNNKAGIDWSNFKIGFGGATPGSGTQAALVYDSTKPHLVDNFTFNMGLKFLKQFGNVKVLSTPKIMALNNQTAILKVVSNHVYFTTAVNTENTQGTATTTVTTQLHSVPIGFVMGVTPFVGTDGDITLQVKPTISRIIGYAKDPNPTLAQAGSESLIPIVQEKEISTILRLRDRQIAILGGLMRDELNNSETGFPLGEKGEFVNNLAGYHQGEKKKTELIIFLRPTVVNTPVGAEFDNVSTHYKYLLPAPQQKKLHETNP